MALTLDEANGIVRGAIAKAQKFNIRISAAVCDGGSRSITLRRMDNAIWASAYGSRARPSPRRLRPVEWRKERARRSADPPRHHHRLGRDDHGSCSRPDHPQQHRRRRLQRRRRYLTTGRRLRPRWRCAIVGRCAKAPFATRRGNSSGVGHPRRGPCGLRPAQSVPARKGPPPALGRIGAN